VSVDGIVGVAVHHTRFNFTTSMAALLLPTRTLQLSISRQSLTNYIVPAFLTGSFGLALPSLHSILNLLPSFLLAVPKKKTSHSKKAMRSANKGLKDKNSLYSLLDRRRILSDS